MSKKIKVIIKRPEEPAGHMTWISDTLKNLQTHVEGNIETLTLASDMVVICNEEGRIRNLPYNCTIENHDFVGTIILAGVDGDEFADVPISLAEFKRFWLDCKD